MRAVLRQTGMLLSSVLMIYALIWLFIEIAFPSQRFEMGLNTALAPSTVFMTEPKYAFMTRSSLSKPRLRAIFIGASNTVVGFKQPEVSALVNGLEIDNLGVGGANITEIAQVVDLVQQVQDQTAREDTTYVLSIWYGEFFENRAKWFSPERIAGDTDVAIEEYRYDFYRRTSSGPVAMLPPRYLAIGVEAVRPFLVLDTLSRNFTARLRAFVHGKPLPDQPGLEEVNARRNAAVLTNAEKTEDLAYWKGQMLGRTDVATEQFDALNALIGKILASGSKVLLVNLPIPKWHEEGAAVYPSFVRQRDVIVKQFAGYPGFDYLDMSDKDNESDFSDEVHPKPTVAPQWASKVVGPLLGLVHP